VTVRWDGRASAANLLHLDVVDNGPEDGLGPPAAVLVMAKASESCSHEEFSVLIVGYKLAFGPNEQRDQTMGIPNSSFHLGLSFLEV